MPDIEELKTFQVDAEKGICLINGKEMSANSKYLLLEYCHGLWSLTITEDKFWRSRPQNVKGLKGDHLDPCGPVGDQGGKGGTKIFTENDLLLMGDPGPQGTM